MRTIFSGKIITIPNLISCIRLLLIPWFAWTYVTKGNGPGTAAILILSGITDTLDGYIARRFDMVSNLGKALDPVADKATQIVMFACLAVRFPHTICILVVLCVKELFVMVSNLLSIHRTKEVLSAAWHGKAATSALYVTMVLHLLFPNMSGTLSDLLIAVCVFLILSSGVLYGVRNVQILCAKKEYAEHE